MGLIEEVQQMKASGVSDQDIMRTLQSKGISPQEAYEMMSQATIKDAVTLDASQENQQYASPSELQPSMIDQTPQIQEASYPQYPQEQYSQDYSQYAPSFSADTITEIADQVISEKMSLIKDKIEIIGDFKTSAESKMKILDERLQKIEKIIDRLQLSILQKVGESITNIDDIKKEMIETQKTFKAMHSSHIHQSSK